MAKANQSKGWLFIAFITVAAVILTALYCWMAGPKQLTDVEWNKVLGHEEPAGLVAAIAAFCAILLYRNTQAPRTAVNAAMIIIVFTCLATPFIAVSWQKSEQLKARKTAAVIYKSVRQEVADSDARYQAKLTALDIPDFAQPSALMRSFDPARLKADLASAGKEKDLHLAEVQNGIGRGRADFQKLDLGSHAESGLEEYDNEFLHPGGAAAQLKAYEDFQLESLAFEVDFLVRNKGRWQAQPEDVVFTDRSLIQPYQQMMQTRHSNDAYLAKLRTFNADQAKAEVF